MKVVLTKHIPFGKYKAISLLGRMYIKSDDTFKLMIKHPSYYFKLVEHERTHWEQQKEMLILPFFVWYGLEWVIKLFRYDNAYRNISFEREARYNGLDTDIYTLRVISDKKLEYIPNKVRGSLLIRKKYFWFKFL